MTTRAPGRRWAPATALAVAGVLAASGGAVLLTAPPTLHVAAAAAPAGPAPAEPGGTPSAPVPDAPAAVPPAAAPSTDAVAAPARLDVPDLGTGLDVVPVGVDDSGALQVPEDPRVAGWWSSGAVPGAVQGSTVLAAHVDAAGVGAGPLSRLLRAPLGTVLDVVTTDGTTVRYAVTERRSYGKDTGLPVELFRADGPARLVVITCSGAFDATTGRYADNAVVIATPA